MGILSDNLGTLGGAAIGFAVGGPTGAAIGASIGSGSDQSRAASKAADIQSGAALAGINEQRLAREQTQSNLQPFLDAATGQVVSSYDEAGFNKETREYDARVNEFEQRVKDGSLAPWQASQFISDLPKPKKEDFGFGQTERVNGGALEQFQNNLDWLKATGGFFGVAISLMIGIKIYKKLRKG